MNNLSARIGMSVMATLLLASCNSTQEHSAQGRYLAPCTADGSPFADKSFGDWQSFYHAGVSAAVEAHLESLQQTTSLPLQCTAGEYADLVPASPALQSIAAGLPAYRETGKLGSLGEADLGAVLLEFLRVYECSLAERQHNHIVRVMGEAGGPVTIGDLDAEIKKEEAIIAEEWHVARPALERTLTLLGGYDRLRPLSLDIECIKRSSLDLRNAMGLAADASSCLPRIWDPHQSVHQFEQSDEVE